MSTTNDLSKAVGEATEEHHTNDLSFEAKVDAPAGIGRGILNIRK